MFSFSSLINKRGQTPNKLWVSQGGFNHGGKVIYLHGLTKNTHAETPRACKLMQRFARISSISPSDRFKHSDVVRLDCEELSPLLPE